jgi:hypothetical protein
MKKRQLLRLIEDLEDRVAELESRPPIYYYLPYTPAPPWQAPVVTTYGTGTGDPMPERSKIWCNSSGECGHE